MRCELEYSYQIELDNPLRPAIEGPDRSRQGPAKRDFIERMGKLPHRWSIGPPPSQCEENDVPRASISPAAYPRNDYVPRPVDHAKFDLLISSMATHPSAKTGPAPTPSAATKVVARSSRRPGTTPSSVTAWRGSWRAMSKAAI